MRFKLERGVSITDPASCLLPTAYFNQMAMNKQSLTNEIQRRTWYKQQTGNEKQETGCDLQSTDYDKQESAYEKQETVLLN